MQIADIKLFETLHGFADGSTLANYLRDACQRNHGMAIQGFLQHVVDHQTELPSILKEARQQWITKYCPADADGQVLRVAGRFALVAAAGELASAIGLLPWPEDEACRAAGTCFRDWLAQRGGTHSAETITGIEQVRAFIEAHGASRFTAIGEGKLADADSKTINRVGFRRYNDKGVWEYLILPKAWKNEVCQGIDSKATASALIDAGYLLPDSKQAAKQVKIPEFGNTRVYHLTANILSGDANA